MLGVAKKIQITKENTTIIDGDGKSADIQARVKQIRAQIEESTSDYDKEKLQERLAKLAGGVAVIKVGAATELEMKEKKARVEDAARHPCRRRRRHRPRRRCRAGARPRRGQGAQGRQPRSGRRYRHRASRHGRAARQIVANAGEEPSVILNKVIEGKGNFGYNAARGEFGDMVEFGILDPTKVTRSALQNAASVAD